MASSIPTEVLTHIFRFLSVSDRKESCLVCRLWYEASLDPILQRDIVLKFLGTNSVVAQELTNGFIRRKLTHLALNQIENSLSSMEVLIKSCANIGHGLKSLCLKGSNITEKTFTMLVCHFKNLEILDLTSCNALFMTGKILEQKSDVELMKETMKNVHTLILSSIRFLSDSTFNRITAICQNLKNISLASSQLSFNSHAYYPHDTKVCNNTAVLTFQSILFFIQQRHEKLKCLNISRTSITNCHLKQIATVYGLKLEKVVLINCRDITSDGISQLSCYQNEIQHLNISGCIDIGDPGFMAITKNLSKLKCLEAKKCQRITDDAVQTLKNLPFLTMLDLSECYQVLSSGLSIGLCSGINIHLTHLNLRCCSSITDDLVVGICTNIPSLQFLDMGSCFPLTDLSVQSISKNLKNLKHLCLTWCKEISDMGLIGFKNVELNTESHVGHGAHGQCRCTRRCDEKVIFRKPTGEHLKKMLTTTQLAARVLTEEERCCLSKIRGLQHLDLSSCEKLTDVSIREAIKFSELKSLNLSSIHSITDISVLAIADGNPSLEEIHLQQCPNITDYSMAILTQKCPRLTYINIASCDLLTNKTLGNIEKKCHRLRHLDVSFCKAMTPEGVDRVEASIESLNSIQRRLVGVF